MILQDMTLALDGGRVKAAFENLKFRSGTSKQLTHSAGDEEGQNRVWERGEMIKLQEGGMGEGVD